MSGLVLTMCVTLNWLYLNLCTDRCRWPARATPLTGAQREAVRHLGAAAVRWEAKALPCLPHVDWGEELRRKRVSYTGEEVLPPLALTWEQVAGGLPPKGVAASISAVDLAVGFVREALERPEELVMLPPAQRRLAPVSARVWATDEEWEKIVGGLYERGIVVPFDGEPYSCDGVPILNGAFGVEKAGGLPESAGAPQALRLIMNFIPTNAGQRMIDGDMGLLPVPGSWANLFLSEEECLLWSSTDRKCFFYVFRLPDCWQKFNVFSKPVDSKVFGRPPGRKTLVAAAVVGMGWLSAVGVAQHLHREMLKKAGRLPPALQPEAEWVRGLPSPMTAREGEACTWSVYIDNFDVQEVVNRAECQALRGSTSPLLEAAIAAYDAWGAAGNPAKDILREPRGTALGEEFDGLEGTRSAPREVLEKLFSLTIWALGRRTVSRKLVQVLLGRWVRAVQFRRAAACVFRASWRWVTNGRFPSIWPLPVVSELVAALALLPLLFDDWRRPLSEVVTASDASERAGAIVASKELTAEGQAAAQTAGRVPALEPASCLLVVSAFDGIGGARRALELCRCPVACYVSIECDEAARRCVLGAWPDTVHWADIEAVTNDMIADLYRRHPRLKVGVLVGGFPCQGLSSLNVHRKGLRDPRSGLFWALHDLWGRLQRVLNSLKWFHLYENVASGPDADMCLVSQTVGRPPLRLDSAGFCHVHRDRLYWLNWVIPGAQLEGKAWPPVRATLEADPGPASRWLDPGCTWGSGLAEQRLPTFVRSTPRSAPPPRPAGLERCDKATRKRWRADSYAMPPYQYAAEHCVMDKAGALRVPSPEEREVLLGFAPGHTKLACRSSLLSRMPEQVRHVRTSLLGNSFQCEAVAYLLGWLWHAEFNFGPPNLANIRAATKHLHPTPEPVEPWKSQRLQTMQQAALWEILRGCDHKGADVRLGTETVSPHTGWPRQAVPASWFKWHTVVTFKWEQRLHINILEAQSILAALRWRTRASSGINQRFLHLTDSQVCLGVTNKKRSSSHLLNLVARKLAALELASFTVPVMGFVRSHLNPADAPSRW